jgi:hypothetical protein
MAITVNNELQLIQADNDFINSVQDNITLFGQIPYTVPAKLIISIIKQSAKYFYRHYWKATQKTYYRLTYADIVDWTNNNNPDVTANGSHFSDFFVKLPGQINVVYEIYESSTNYNMPTSQELLGNIQLLQMTAPYGNTIAGINNSLYITEAVCRMIENQAYDSILGMSVPFNYNNLTHKLNIHKDLNSISSYNLMLDCLVNVDIQLLYQDDLYFRHVIGRCKQELKRLIASHTIELPGGATLNADEVCNNLEDVEKVEEILKNSGGIGDIIMMR